MLIHEVVVALVVGVIQTSVFVKIDRCSLGEVYLAVLAPLSQAVIDADGGGAGSQSQNAVRFRDNLSCQNVRCHLAHFFVILYCNDIHTNSLLKLIIPTGYDTAFSLRDILDIFILAMKKHSVNGITDLCNLFVFLCHFSFRSLGSLVKPQMIQRNSFFQKYLIVSARVNPVGQKNHAFPRIHIHQNRGSGKAGMIQDMVSVFLVPSQASIFERGIQNRLEHPFAEQSSVPLQICLHEIHQIRKRGKASICSRRSSRQGLVQAQTLARCSRKK